MNRFEKALEAYKVAAAGLEAARAATALEVGPPPPLVSVRADSSAEVLDAATAANSKLQDEHWQLELAVHRRLVEPAFELLSLAEQAVTDLEPDWFEEH